MRFRRRAAQKTAGTLTYAYSLEPSALSTIATSPVPVALVATKLFEGLLNYEGPSLQPKPGLAVSWTISEDKKTYTFKLRPGVKLHNGNSHGSFSPCLRSAVRLSQKADLAQFKLAQQACT